MMGKDNNYEVTGKYYRTRTNRGVKENVMGKDLNHEEKGKHQGLESTGKGERGRKQSGAGEE
jgi:hypothetical protein